MFERESTSAELLEALTTTDLEDYGSCRIAKIAGDEAKIYVECEVSFDESPHLDGIWQIECLGVRRNRLKLGFVDRILVENDHILLVDYREPVLRLGFKGVGDEQFAVVGALYWTHRKLGEDWIPFSSYFLSRNVFDLINGGFGTLAEGPKSFIDAYDRTLRDFGIETNISGERLPVQWIEEGFGGEFKPFPELTAFILDECFVVAEDFRLSRV